MLGIIRRNRQCQRTLSTKKYRMKKENQRSKLRLRERKLVRSGKANI
jgi:hypothetical protein